MFSFCLSTSFIDSYRDKKPPFGFPDAAGTSLGEITFLRTYSRKKEDGTKETWVDVCERVINGMYSIQKDFARSNRLPWSDAKAAASAKEAFDRLFNLKWTPPGRGLWVMGTPLVMAQKNSAPLQNCAFTSTGSMTKNQPSKPFRFLMEASMLGVGVGFDQKGADHDFKIYRPGSGRHENDPYWTYEIPDTREGWVESVGMLIDSYLRRDEPAWIFDYSLVRPAGSPIKTFGGEASGPGPLRKLHDHIRSIFDGREGEHLTRVDIADIGNLIGSCVVAGNVRRSAELLMGSLNDPDFLNLKNPDVFPARNSYSPDSPGWGWLSNNSIEVAVGDDLDSAVEHIARNGEPGVIWMDVTRKYGRLADPENNKDWRASGYNPCAEQSLESGEMCVSGDTLIQTESGLAPIRSLVGQRVNVWNGSEWAPVTPFSTGRNALYRVTLSDGSFLDATPGHEWSVRRPTQRVFTRVQTRDLKVGMRLPEFELESPDGKPNEHAYTYGWVAGDGYIADDRRVMGIVKADEYSILDHLGGTVYKEQSFNNGSDVRYSRVHLSESVPLDAAIAMRREDRLPDEVFSWDYQSISDFFGGWIDTDGSLVRNPNTDHYVLYGSENKLRQAQILLRRIGVNHSTLRVFSEKGVETNKGTRNQALYRLLIPSYEAAAIGTKIKVAQRFGSRFRKNNAHLNSDPIDAARKQNIVSIEKVSDDADTYCFNEPMMGMGVFGNVLTYQCTLVETYLNRHESLEDFKRTLKFAYLYAKTVTLLPTHWAETNAIMQRNRRIGTSMSGVADFADLHGLPTLRRWMDEGYETVRRYDHTYSEWLGIRESIKMTTVKPSGTVSILAGESPGVHWGPGGEYFMRAIRFRHNDPMIPLLSAAGYRIEPASESPDTTSVVFFPIHSKSKRSDKDVSIFEKIALAATAQRFWSDNSVSVTVSFNAKEEADYVGTVLKMYDGQLKTVSFLPQGNDVYPQMPYTQASKEEYEEYGETLMPADLSMIYEGLGFEAVGEKFCTTDACLVEIEVPEVPKKDPVWDLLEKTLEIVAEQNKSSRRTSL